MILRAFILWVCFSPALLMAQWQPLNLPEGPQFLGMVGDEEGRILVTTSKVWHWTPGQTAVTVSSTPATLSGSTTLFLNNGIVYLRDPLSASGLYYSLNRGMTWQNFTGFTGVDYKTLQIHAGRVWARHFADLQLFYTENFGTTWVEMNTLDIGTDRIEGFNQKGDTLIALLSSRIARSFDTGTTWEYSPAPVLLPSIFNNAAVFNTNGYYFLWYGGAIGQGFRSSDGVNWTQVVQPFSLKPEFMGISGGRMIVHDRPEVWSSDDDGLHWEERHSPGGSAHLLAYADEWIMSSQAGVFTLRSDKVLASLNHFFPVVQDDVPNDPGVLITTPSGLVFDGGSGVYFSEDMGDSWVTVPKPLMLGNYAAKGDTIVSDAWISTNGGRNWQDFVIPLSSITHFFFAGDTLYSNDVYTFKRSMDLGLHYEPVPTPDNFTIKGAVKIDNYIYVLRQQSPVQIWRTANHGVTWTNVSDGLPTLSTTSRLLSDDERPYLCVPGKIYRLEQDQWILSDSTSTGPTPPFQMAGKAGISIMTQNRPGLLSTPDHGVHWYNSLFTIKGAGESLRIAISENWVFVANFHTPTNSWRLYKRPLSDFQGLPITGTTYKDLDENQVLSSDDLPQPHIPVYLSPSGTATLSNSDGRFELFNWQDGDTLSVSLVPPYDAVDPTFYLVPASGGNFDFAVSSQEVPADWAIYLTNLTAFKPGEVTKLFVNMQQSMQMGHPWNVHLALPPNLTALDVQPPPDHILNNGKELVWDTLYSATPGFADICIEVRVDSMAMLGDTIQIAAWLDIDELNLLNNHDSISTAVVSSFDPNDKRGLPATLTPQQGDSGTELTYFIRFQNTGNAPAFTVRLVDTLPAEVLLQTFRFESASHPVNWTIKPGRIAEFSFNGIQLPDSSSNEVESHGFVRFSIQTRLGLLPGAHIDNTAHIYFDLNEPVQTNTSVIPVLQTNTSEEMPWSAADLLVLPNPAKERLFLKISNQAFNAASIWITDISGRQTSRWENVSADSFQVVVSNWPAGVYFVSAQQGTSIYVTRFIVIK